MEIALTGFGMSGQGKVQFFDRGLGCFRVWGLVNTFPAFHNPPDPLCIHVHLCLSIIYPSIHTLSFSLCGLLVDPLTRRQRATAAPQNYSEPATTTTATGVVRAELFYPEHASWFAMLLLGA